MRKVLKNKFMDEEDKLMATWVEWLPFIGLCIAMIRRSWFNSTILTIWALYQFVISIVIGIIIIGFIYQ